MTLQRNDDGDEAGRASESVALFEDVLARVPQLPMRDQKAVRDMVEGSEWELAFEVLCTQLYEWDIGLPPSTLEYLESLRIRFDVDPRYTTVLRGST